MAPAIRVVAASKVLAIVSKGLQRGSTSLGPSSTQHLETVQRAVSLAALHCWQPWTLPRGFSAVPAPADEDGIALTDNAVERLHELLADARGKVLRLTVEAGGCSGFSYKFDIDDSQQEDDRVFESHGVRLVTDGVSYEFVKGSTVDYSQELIRSAFEVVGNPNADKGCGCGTSFAPK